MIPTALRALLKEPALLLHHLDAYRELAQAEASVFTAQWRHRVLWTAVAAAAAVLALLLAGVALLLLAVVPVAAMPAPWVLAVVPGVPALVAAWGFWRATRAAQDPAFGRLREQLAQDGALLRQQVAP